MNPERKQLDAHLILAETVRKTLGLDAVADHDDIILATERLKADAESFHMDYRMKCDEETKVLRAENAKLRAERDEALRRLGFYEDPVARLKRGPLAGRQDNEKSCPRDHGDDREHGPSVVLHTCPYQVEVHGDHETLCNCCEKCDERCQADADGAKHRQQAGHQGGGGEQV